MGLITRAKRAISGGPDTESRDEDEEEQPPSHICESCGEEYYTNPDTDIEKCRQCGGIKVKSAQS